MMGIPDLARRLRQSSTPSMLGIRRSVITRSGVHDFITCHASSPSEAVRTEYPRAESVVLRTRAICASSSTTRIFGFSPTAAIGLPHLLGHDVYVYGWRVTQELVDGGKVKILSPIGLRRATKDNLSNVLVPHYFGDFFRHMVAFRAQELRAQAFGKSDVLRQSPLIFGAFVSADIYVNHVQLRINTLRHAGGARD